MEKQLAKQTLRIYTRSALRYKKFVVGLLIVTPLGVLLNNYILPYIIAQAINRLSEAPVAADDVWSVFGWWIIAFAATAIAGELIAQRVGQYLIWKLESKVTFDLRARCFSVLTGQSLRFHGDRFSGSLIAQASKFVSSYVRLADTVFDRLIPLVASFVFVIVILGPLLPLYTTVLMVLCALYAFFAYRGFLKLRKLSALQAEADNKTSGMLADSVSNIGAIKSDAGELHEQKRFAVANKNAQSAVLALMWGSLNRELSFSLILIPIAVLTFVVLVGGQAWFSVQLGTLVLAISYTFTIVQRLWDFNSVLRGFNRALGDAQEMSTTMQLENEVQDIAKPKSLTIRGGNIEFKNAAFTHPASNQNEVLFKNFNLQIKSGEKIGLVGHSGSGKTTLTRLLLRFMDVDAGSIEIDGQNISQVTQTSLRRAIAYVPQEPLLFHRSLRENIAYGRPGATQREIEHAAKLAHAAEFIDKLPDGYGTLVGERGVKLSGGQRQRIAIARAMLKNAPILVLDEATSALDSESEKLIQAALWKLMEGRTSIVIAHRLSTIARMDRIVVLEQGKIIETGSHHELLAQKGTYHSLWSHQSGGFLDE